MPHDAFISYSRKNRAFAVLLEKALENFQPPKDLSVPQRRLDIFRDEEDFTGAEYFQSVDLHLGDAARLIVLCSPAARASTFVNDEIRRFASHRGPQHIIALLVDGIPNNEAGPDPEQQAQRAFPDALCECMTMPLAADYRRFDPKKSRVDRGAYEGSWYTTLANLYGVSRAQIEERDRKRRTRQRRVIAVASIASVAVLAGLSLIAWQKQREADARGRETDAGILASQAVAQSSLSPSEGLRISALLGAESLRKAWTDEGYKAWRRATLEMAPIVGQITTDSTGKLAFSGDGQRLFARCEQSHVHVFSIDTLQERKLLQVEDWAVDLAADASGDQVLVFHAGDSAIQVGDVRTGTMRSISLPGALESAGFGPSGEVLVASLWGLSVIDTSSDAVQSRLRLPRETQWVALARDGATLLAADGHSVIAYDTVSGERSWQTEVSNDVMNTLFSLSGDGQFLLVRTSPSAAILNVASGAMVQAGATVIEARTVRVVTLLDRSRYLMGRDIFTVKGPLEEHERSLGFETQTPRPTAVISNLGRYAAGSLPDMNGGFVVVDLSRNPQSISEGDATLRLTMPAGHKVRTAVFSKDERMLAVSTSEASVGPVPRSELQLLSLQHPRWRTIVPQESRSGNLFVLPPNARVVSKRLGEPAPRVFSADGSVVNDDATGTRVSVSGRFAARQDQNEQWLVTDLTNKRTVTVPGNGSPLEFAPDERRVLVFPNVYSLDDPHAVQTVANAGGPLYQTWSFPGARLVIGKDAPPAAYDDKPSMLFDWSTGRAVAGPSSGYSQYAVAPDGVHFVTNDLTDGLRLWEVGGDAPLFATKKGIGSDSLLTFNSSGTLLAAGGCKSAAVYDARTLRLLFNVFFKDECFVGFSTDGKYLVSRHLSGAFPEPTLHPLTLAGVLAETCAKVTANLSSQEWTRFNPNFSLTQTCSGDAAQRVREARQWIESL